MMKFSTLLAIFCLSLAHVCANAQTKDADSTEEKQALKVSKDELKEKVRSRSNGDTMVGKIKMELGHKEHLPDNLDSYLIHFFPSLDLTALNSSVEVWKKKNSETSPVLKDLFSAVNAGLSRQNVRLKQANAGESNIRSRINAGIPLYWVSNLDYEVMPFLHERNAERTKHRNLADWKKSLNSKQYKKDPNLSRRNALYFFIVGYNSQSGEIAISTSPEMDPLFWITAGELKKYNNMLWEPTL
jgi:hypothetical protein